MKDAPGIFRRRRRFFFSFLAVVAVVFTVIACYYCFHFVHFSQSQKRIKLCARIVRSKPGWNMMELFVTQTTIKFISFSFPLLCTCFAPSNGFLALRCCQLPTFWLFLTADAACDASLYLSVGYNCPCGKYHRVYRLQFVLRCMVECRTVVGGGTTNNMLCIWSSYSYTISPFACACKMWTNRRLTWIHATMMMCDECGNGDSVQHRASSNSKIKL